MRNAAWWLIYIIAAIWLQRLLPGVDALAPGLLICLQGASRRQIAVFLAFCMIIQEGTGTLPSGPSIIWYGYVLVSYHICGVFFLPGSKSFILSVSAALCVGRAALFLVMSALQSNELDTSGILFQCLAQALIIIPLVWILAGISRSRALKNAH